MCGPVQQKPAGCGGGGATTPAQSEVHGAHGATTQGPAKTALQSSSPLEPHEHGAKAGATALGQKYGAWNSTAQFAVVSSNQEQHHGSAHEKIVLQRTSADDMQRANQVFQASMSKLANLRWDQTQAPSDEPGSDHRVVPAALKAEWKAAYPGLPVPNRVVFDKASGRPVGALFVGGEKAPDLGMGALHQHNAGGAIMQHIWFTPGDMNLAFGDAPVKKQAVQAALAR